MYVIGPIDWISAGGQKYCVCIVCDALMELIMNVGLPSVIKSDQETNFTANLTRELLNLMGCSPRKVCNATTSRGRWISCSRH